MEVLLCSAIGPAKCDGNLQSMQLLVASLRAVSKLFFQNNVIVMLSWNPLPSYHNVTLSFGLLCRKSMKIKHILCQ